MSDSVRPHRQQPTRLHPGVSRQEHWSGFPFPFQCMKLKSESEVAQSCPTLCHPIDCSLPGSSVHGIFQARVLEWVAIAFSTSLSLGLPYCLLSFGFLWSLQPNSPMQFHLTFCTVQMCMCYHALCWKPVGGFPWSLE